MTAVKEEPLQIGNPRFAQEAMNVFFLAMQADYINSPPTGVVTELPGSSSIEFIYGRWRLLDVYTTTRRSDMSAGTTHLWYDNIPVWMMQYMGQYQPEALPVLKRALARAYIEYQWNGGRGPAYYTDGHYVYENNVEKDGEFAGRCSGEEFIMRQCGGGGILGWHRYQSIYML